MSKVGVIKPSASSVKDVNKRLYKFANTVDDYAYSSQQTGYRLSASREEAKAAEEAAKRIAVEKAEAEKKAAEEAERQAKAAAEKAEAERRATEEVERQAKLAAEKAEAE